MALSDADRTVITDLISLHGHLVDGGELDRLDEVFTADVVYDVTDLGGGAIEGLAALRAAALAMGDSNPVGHHVTNIILTPLADGRVHARSKGIGVTVDGRCGSVTYEDTISRGDQDWRIAHRRVLARRVPLS
ncbi:hypothetical protein GCM10027176_67510 [Actinoallomurus bryophytorum]|uniref:SnoaL-like protein n=1 Tax=Actinoallomurus bryophytorum TaxID=1490222 RepID=A0A543BSN3_9ACTN|nr:nuclear transport factor 2 family protein [Actinoallomurus bryophytorum]TQL87820.1 SnoaL-like protein [Actinoallomurus bryophytorum]